MTETTQTPANSNRRAFNMLGTVSNIEVRQDKNQKPYTVFSFSTVLRGKETTRMAMAFGAAHDAINGIVPGEQRIYARIDGGVFNVIGFGRAVKEKVAA
jgi:hypothetical protein